MVWYLVVNAILKVWGKFSPDFFIYLIVALKTFIVSSSSFL
jgi:hypothetical protein